jgi:hypothetical protein
MFEDLVNVGQELLNMLSDVQENYADSHPDDVMLMLDNCQFKAMELTEQIKERRQNVLGLAPYWKVRAGGADAGMPPARATPGVPPVT